MRIIAILAFVATAWAQTGAKNGEWPAYGADLGNTHYSPLDPDRRLQLQQAGNRLAL